MPCYLLMENNTQNRPPQRKKMAPKDLILIALAILVMFRVDWSNMNSFHYLILFLLFLCFMLRWSNMRKEAQRQELLRKKAEYEAAMAAKEAAQEPAQLTGETVEVVSTEEASVDGEPVPTEEPTPETPAEEKTEE